MAQASACNGGFSPRFVNGDAMSSSVSGRRSITADTAMRLAQYFGTSAQMWMNLQTAYDLEVAAKKAAIKREVIPASKRAA